MDLNQRPMQRKADMLTTRLPGTLNISEESCRSAKNSFCVSCATYPFKMLSHYEAKLCYELCISNADSAAALNNAHHNPTHTICSHT